jgi:dihydroorotase
MTQVKSLTIRRPDDFHVHLREGELLESVLPHTASVFSRALVMPNLKKPVLTAPQARAYRDEIRQLCERQGLDFEPLMTVKLTQATSPMAIRAAREANVVAAKLYPEGVTTNSEDGVHDFRALDHTLGAMQDSGLVLCVHPEEPGVFSLDREAAYLKHIEWAAKRFPDLKIVVEHVTTAAAVAFVRGMGPNVAATITAHHLFLTLDDVIGDKLRPHNFCKPIAKRAEDRAALVEAVVTAQSKFFLGTDSAPHRKGDKECDGGCAGCFTAPLALPLIAGLFEDAGALDKLESFTSVFGASFYGLKLNSGRVVLERADWQVPAGYGPVVPFKAGETMHWKVCER